MMIQDDYLSELNPVQREAVLATEGPVLIVAGAGSGKTRVLIYRMIHLVKGCGVNPSNILGVTFTNRAAEEMRSRIMKSLGEIADRIWIATFHSTCAQILRQEIYRLGYSRNFVIYDEEDSLSLIKRVMKEKNLDEKMLSPKWLRAKIEWLKRDMVNLDGEDFKAIGPYSDNLKMVYLAYQEQLRLANALDFNDLLLLTVNLFSFYPDVLARYQERFRYIMVDEYQDTNYIQYLLVQALARKYKNICVVGDEDQSIYRWRGANIENILNFTTDFPDAKVIKLTQNYRSVKRIIESASALISHNTRRIAKTLWTENPEGEKIRVIACADEREEAERVVETILRLQAENLRYSDCAIFYRMHAQSRVIEDELRRREIPYQIFGGLRFYERKEVKDILAYLRLLINPDDSVSLLRIINTPSRGIGPATIEQLNKISQERNISLFQALEQSLGGGYFSDRAINSLREFLELIASLRSQWLKGGSLKELAEFTIKRTGYQEELIKEGTVESEARLGNLEELINAFAEYEAKEKEPSLEGFLEKSALFQDTEKFSEKGMVTLMTLHSAKGLEFPAVFIVGLEEGVFPHIRALEEEELNPDEIEEERRLCYVGMTRARQKLFLFYSAQRMMRGQFLESAPSRFLTEIPEEHLQIEHKRKAKLIKSEKIERRKEKRPIIEAEFEDSQIEVWDSELEISWKKGVKVRHPKFGEGVVEKVEGSEDKIKLVVKFKSGDKKKLMAKHARLEIIG